MKFRIVDGYVVDASDSPEEQFHPDIASQFVNAPVGAPEGAGVGWRTDGVNWFAPAQAPEPPPVAPTYAALTFVQFLALATMAGQMDDDDYATARANTSLMIYFDALMNAQGIERDNPMTARGGAKFVQLGMLTQEGWDAMLANWPTV